VAIMSILAIMKIIIMCLNICGNNNNNNNGREKLLMKIVENNENIVAVKTMKM
jgi:hypothetical protein